MSFNIEVESGNSVRLPTAGKYCDRDIIVTATGGGGSDDGSYDEGYAAGQQAEYDRFWDEFQQSGNRRNYSYAFWQPNWTDECYQPKYPIIGTNGGHCFYSNTSITDTKVDINFTTTESVAVFRYASKLKTIRKIILSPTTTLYRWFEGCIALEDISFEGTYEYDNVDTSPCAKLTKNSITSLLNALSATATGKTAKFSLVAVNREFATSSGANNGSTSSEWAALTGTKTNWTITLA